VSPLQTAVLNNQVFCIYKFTHGGANHFIQNGATVSPSPAHICVTKRANFIRQSRETEIIETGRVLARAEDRYIGSGAGTNLKVGGRGTRPVQNAKTKFVVPLHLFFGCTSTIMPGFQRYVSVHPYPFP